MTRHGTPTARLLSGISRVTTLPAPITQLSPTVTPGQTVTFAPNQQLLPILTGLARQTRRSMPSGNLTFSRSSGKKRMQRCYNRHIRSEIAVIAYCDGSIILNSQIEIGKQPVAYYGMAAVMDKQRSLKKSSPLPAAKRYLSQYCSAARFHLQMSHCIFVQRLCVLSFLPLNPHRQDNTAYRQKYAVLHSYIFSVNQLVFCFLL